jgi:hypothetical protein
MGIFIYLGILQVFLFMITIFLTSKTAKTHIIQGEILEKMMPILSKCAMYY